MSSNLDITVSSITDLPGAARKIIEFAGDYRIFLLDAPMGGGKTTLIKEICRTLGSNDHFSSPTFSIVNEYKYPGGKIYHFDLYRLKDEKELLDLGIEEYLDSGHYCFFEWPELVKGFIETGFVELRIQIKENIHYIRGIKF